jgi:hypothetical protein
MIFVELSAGESEVHIASRRSMAPASGATCAGSTGNGASLEIAQT